MIAEFAFGYGYKLHTRKKILFPLVAERPIVNDCEVKLKIALKS